MKNKLTDVNDLLILQLERLSDIGMTEEKIILESRRAKSVANISQQIIANGRLALDAQVALGDNLIQQLPDMLQLAHKK